MDLELDSVGGILLAVSECGSDPTLLRILRLRVDTDVMLDKRNVLLNVGAFYATVRDCAPVVVDNLRPQGTQIVLAVAGIIKR